MGMVVKIICAVAIFVAILCSTVEGDYVNGSFVVTTYAGNGASTANGIAATSASINITDSANVWVNQSTIYFAEPFRNQVRYIDPSTLTVKLLAGTGTASSTGNGGQATSATLNYPRSVCAFKSSLYVVEGRSHCIRKVDMVTGIISTFAGTCGTAGTGLTGTSVAFNGPMACVADTTGALYVSEGFLGSNCRIRKISSSTSTAVFTGDGNCGAVDRLSRVGKVPSLSIDSSGALFFSGDRNVRRVDSSANNIAFVGSLTIGFKDGILTSAQCNNVGGVWVDSTGALYFSDITLSGTEVIRYVSSQRITVGTISFGRYASNEFTNGVELWDAYFDGIGGIMGDSTGAFYITARNSAVIRKASFPSPTASPTQSPTVSPTASPTISARPSVTPTAVPTVAPSFSPSYTPTATPSFVPTVTPSAAPSAVPTTTPSVGPTYVPSYTPSAAPTATPSYSPSCTPSHMPTAVPTAAPSASPIAIPTATPTVTPSYSPSCTPSYAPTAVPTAAPSASPTAIPTVAPTVIPSYSPSQQPTMDPTAIPSVVPTTLPSIVPTATPTWTPTQTPTFSPSMVPSASPSVMPTATPTHAPTVTPSEPPSAQPSTIPTAVPTYSPTWQPSYAPTISPTWNPSAIPTVVPSFSPTQIPTQPTCHPTTACPSSQPSSSPSSLLSKKPTKHPTMWPTSQPSRQPSNQPTSTPSTSPSCQPSSQPSKQPAGYPTRQPTNRPSSQPTNQPTRQPSSYPTGQPSRQPSSHPSMQPSTQPSRQPSGQPSRQPSTQPSSRPSLQPSSQPSARPSVQPTLQPSRQPTTQPTSQPTGQPSRQPTRKPTSQPTGQPTRQPTGQPTGQPTRSPSTQPTSQPTSQPSSQPLSQPLSQPSCQPSACPSVQPSSQPTFQSTGQPTRQPTGQPTGQPTRIPTTQPTSQPSGQPTSQPVALPTAQPSTQPSTQPSFNPTACPTTQPSSKPSEQPSIQPTSLPSSRPSVRPSSQPMSRPSCQPTVQPSCEPSAHPTSSPSQQPSSQPSIQPSALPSGQPSSQPVSRPSTSPSNGPTSEPSRAPSSAPSSIPSTVPTTGPFSSPTVVPSGSPTVVPSRNPSSMPSFQPVSDPTSSPSVYPATLPSRRPTSLPSISPTAQPSGQPSRCPSSATSVYPTSQPSCQPTRQPSGLPSSQPSCQPSAYPSTQPSKQPSNVPSTQPSAQPSRQPTVQPSGQPSRQPTSQPSAQPSAVPSISLFRSSAKSVLSAELSLTAAVINVNIKMGQDLMTCPSPLATRLTTSVAGLPVSAWQSLWTSRWSVAIQLFYEVMRPRHFSSPIIVALQGCGVKMNTTISIAPLAFSVTVSSPVCNANRTCVIPLVVPSAVTSLGWPLQNVSIRSSPVRSTSMAAKMSNLYVVAMDQQQMPRVNVSACTITGRCVETVVSLPSSPRNIGVSLVLGQTGPVYWRSKPLYLFSQLLLPDSSAVRRWNFTHNWTVVDTSSGVAVQSLGRSMDPSLLVFPSFSLSADSTYQAVVSLVEIGITSSPLLFSVTADPIVVVMQPSQLTHYVAVGDSIRLDASKSYDANSNMSPRSNSELSFAWQCVDDPASLCQLRSTALTPLNSVMDVTVTERAVAGAMFRLRVVVRHRASNRQAEVTVLIVVQPKGTPRIDLMTNTSILSWRNVPTTTAAVWAVQAQVNRSSCLESAACTLAWSVASTSSGGTFSADMKTLARVAAVQTSATWQRQTITFYPSSFATGVLYTFRVTLGTQRALAEVDITLNRPPFGGILDVTPRLGVAMQTKFHLAAYGWKDDTSSDYPLAYDYRYFLLNQWWQLINPSVLPFVEETRLPWNTSVSVRVTVADVCAATSTAVRSVRLTKVPCDQWRISSYWQLINATFPTTTVTLRQGGLILVDLRSRYVSGMFTAATLIPVVTALQVKVNGTVVQRTDTSMLTMGQALVSNINLFRLELQLQAARDQVYNDLFASSSASTNASAQGSLDQASKAFDSLAPLLLGMLNAGTSTGSTTVNTVTISTGGMTASFSVISFGSSSSSSDNSTAPSAVSLSIPNSANSISLSSTGGADTAGVMVSLVQLDASSLKSSFLKANSTTNGTTAGNAAAAALTQAKLSSDVITIQLISASTNGSKSSLALPTFDATLTLTSSSTDAETTGPTSLHHNCSVGVRETVSLFCRESKVRVNITCTGDVAATVKRSCPVSKHVCSVLNLADNTVASNDYCQAIVTGSSVLCRCGYNTQSGNSSSNAALLALNGRISVAAFSSFATGELDSSVSLAGASLGANLAGQSIVIFVTFSCFWGIAIVLMGVQHMRSQGMWWPESHKTKKHSPSSITPITTDTAAALSHEHPTTNNRSRHRRHAATKAQERDLDKQSDGFYSYLVTMLPPALVSSEPWWHRLRTTLLTRHLYFRAVQVLFVPHRPTEDAMKSSHGQRAQATFELEQRRRKLDVIHVLTALTMSCFVLALLYDLQYPADDGYCGAQLDQSTCLYRKSLLDPWRSRCIWIAQLNVHPVAAVVTESLHGQIVDKLEVNAEEDATVLPCQLNDVNSSQVAFISSFFITSIFATILDFFLDFSFEILNADFSKNATARRDAMAADARRHAQAQAMAGAITAGGAMTAMDVHAMETRAAEGTTEPTHRSPWWQWWSTSTSMSWPRWRTDRRAVSPHPHAAACEDVHPQGGHTHDNDDENLKLMVMVVPDAVMNARRRWVTSASTVERAGGPRGRRVVVARQQRRHGTVVGSTMPQLVSSAYPASAASSSSPSDVDAPSTSVVTTLPSRGRRAAISVMPVLTVPPSTANSGAVPMGDHHTATSTVAITAPSASNASSHAPPPPPSAHGGGGGGGHSSHLALASDAEYGVSLMHVVVADAIETLSGSLEKRNIVLHTIRRSYAEMYFVHEAWQYVFMAILLVMNGGAFYFIISKAAMRGVSWQFAFLRACSLEWFTEIFIIEVLECLLLDFALPAYVHHDVLQCVAMFVHLHALRMGQKHLPPHHHQQREDEHQHRQQPYVAMAAQQQQAQQSSAGPTEDAASAWSSLSNETLRASDAPLIALALLRPNVKESRFALVCHDYMASRTLRHGSFLSSGEGSAPSDLSAPMSRWVRWWGTLRRTLRRGLRRVFDWYCRRSAGTQETIINVVTSVLVAVSIFFWFAIVQPALVSGNLIAASITWLVVLCAGLYVAGRVLFAIRRAQPTLITPWTDPLTAMDAAMLSEAEVAKRKEKEALQHEVKLDDDDDDDISNDSGDNGRSLDDDLSGGSSKASSWSFDAQSWSDFSHSNGSADGRANDDVDEENDDDVDDDGGGDDGRDSPVSSDSQQWAMFSSTAYSSSSATSRRPSASTTHQKPAVSLHDKDIAGSESDGGDKDDDAIDHRSESSYSDRLASLRTYGSDREPVVDRQWSLSQSDEAEDHNEGDDDPNELFDDWDDFHGDDDADDVDDDVDDPLHRTPTGKASSSASSTRFSFE